MIDGIDIDRVARRGSDRRKLASNGWDLMLNAGNGGGWLGRALIHRLTDDELAYLRRSGRAACVGVNAGRIDRDLRRRHAQQDALE